MSRIAGSVLSRIITGGDNDRMVVGVEVVGVEEVGG